MTLALCGQAVQHPSDGENTQHSPHTHLSGVDMDGDFGEMRSIAGNRKRFSRVARLEVAN